jgi:hypothetical protein
MSSPARIISLKWRCASTAGSDEVAQEKAAISLELIGFLRLVDFWQRTLVGRAQQLTLF